MSNRKRETDREPNSESDWREGFRGGFGNSGQLSKAAYNRNYDPTRRGGDSTQGRSFGTSEVEREGQSESPRREPASGPDRANADRNNTHESELEQSTNRSSTGRFGSAQP